MTVAVLGSQQLPVAGKSTEQHASRRRHDVVHDERSRPTYAEALAKGIKHLLTCGPDKAPYGTYHVTSAGDAVSRDELAMAVFIGAGDDPVLERAGDAVAQRSFLPGAVADGGILPEGANFID